MSTVTTTTNVIVTKEMRKERLDAFVADLDKDTRKAFKNIKRVYIKYLTATARVNRLKVNKAKRDAIAQRKAERSAAAEAKVLKKKCRVLLVACKKRFVPVWKAKAKVAKLRAQKLKKDERQRQKEVRETQKVERAAARAVEREAIEQRKAERAAKKAERDAAKAEKETAKAEKETVKVESPLPPPVILDSVIEEADEEMELMAEPIMTTPKTPPATPPATEERAAWVAPDFEELEVDGTNYEVSIPAKEPALLKDGSGYGKPKGRMPKGMEAWNSEHGIWLKAIEH